MVNGLIGICGKLKIALLRVRDSAAENLNMVQQKLKAMSQRVLKIV